MKEDADSISTTAEQAMKEKEETSSKNELDISEGKTRSGLDHPFSIESILNGTTKRRKRKSSVEEEERREMEQNDALPLNALEEFTSKTFSTMRTGRSSKNEEGPILVRERLKLLTNKTTAAKKTRRKARTCFTNQQIYELERRFLYQKYLSPQDRDELSEMLNLSNAQVITWFQNRRAKLKRDIEEMRNDLAASQTLHPPAGCREYHCRRYAECR